MTYDRMQIFHAAKSLEKRRSKLRDFSKCPILAWHFNWVFDFSFFLRRMNLSRLAFLFSSIAYCKIFGCVRFLTQLARCMVLVAVSDHGGSCGLSGYCEFAAAAELYPSKLEMV